MQLHLMHLQLRNETVIEYVCICKNEIDANAMNALAYTKN